MKENEKFGSFPIMEKCTVMEGLKQRLMLYKIGEVCYYEAREHIQSYFQCERGVERMNEDIAYMIGKENKEGFIKRFKNTTDEALLYPLLYQEALLELEEMRVSDKHKKRAKGHLERFMKEWENTRKDEAVKPQQKTPKYTEELIRLFNDNIHLIDELIGKSDKEIANCVTQWARGKDKFGKPLIENPSNGLKKAFAEALKGNGIIRESIRTFRDRL